MLGKAVNELQRDVVIADNEVTGTLKYIDGYVGFSSNVSEQSGNYFTKVTDVIDTFVVRSLLQLQDVGMSSAAGLMQSVINFVILISVNAVVRRTQRDYALF